MPRLFTGLEVPAQVGQRLAQRRGGVPGARWIDPAMYHVTLRFAGDIDHAAAADLAELLDGIRRPAFEIEIQGLGAFGGSKPRAIIANIVPSRPLLDLQAEHEWIARRAGLAPETRKFTPHITLARLGPPALAYDVAAYLTLQGPFERLKFAARGFQLYSARESRGGGPYIVESRYPLATPAGRTIAAGD